MTLYRPSDRRIEQLRFALKVLRQYYDTDCDKPQVAKAVGAIDELFPGQLNQQLRVLEEILLIDDYVEQFIEFMKVRTEIFLTIAKISPQEYLQAMDGI